MGICGRLINLQIDNKQEHLATTWVIARDPQFKDIIFESADDTQNLEVIEIDVVLEKGVKYYGRARPRTLRGGWGEWHNMDIFTTNTLDESMNTFKIPSRIGAPRIKSVSDNKFCDRSQHPLTDFSLQATGYAVIGNNKHTSTSWYIEDLDRNVIWKREKVPFLECVTNPDCYVDNKPLKDGHACVKVNDIILECNKVYRARCCFYNETNDVSDTSSYTFVTTRENNPALKAFLQHELKFMPFDITQNKTLSVPMDNYDVLDPATDTAVVEITIEKLSGMDKGRVFNSSCTTDSPNIVIPGNTLQRDNYYIVKYRSSKIKRNIAANEPWRGDPWEAFYFTTF